MSCGPGYSRVAIIRFNTSCDGCVADQDGRIMTAERSVERKASLSGSIEPWWLTTWTSVAPIARATAVSTDCHAGAPASGTPGMSPPVKKSKRPSRMRSPMLHMFSDGVSSAVSVSSGGNTRVTRSPSPLHTSPLAATFRTSTDGKAARLVPQHDLIGAADANPLDLHAAGPLLRIEKRAVVPERRVAGRRRQIVVPAVDQRPDRVCDRRLR